MYYTSDFLIQIKNAYLAKKDQVSLPFSKMGLGLSKILKARGFIEEYEVRKKKIKKTERQFIEIKLNPQSSQNIVSQVKIISKPSRRIYVKSVEIKPVISGFGLSVVSTSRGLMSGEEARKMKLGGEMLVEIW